MKTSVGAAWKRVVCAEAYLAVAAVGAAPGAAAELSFVPLGLSIAVAHVSAQDDANSAAVAAATAWVSDKGALAPTLLAAQNSAAQHDETVLPNSLTVGTDGTVHLKLERDATTLVIRHIGPLRSWARVIVKGSGKADATS